MNSLENGLFNALENVRFAIGWPGSQAKKIVETYVKTLWKEEKLPYQVRDGVWLVGWRVNKTFFECGIIPICVGPAKPSKCRQRHYNNVCVSIR